MVRVLGTYWLETEIKYIKSKFFIIGFVSGSLITFGGCVILGFYL